MRLLNVLLVLGMGLFFASCASKNGTASSSDSDTLVVQKETVTFPSLDGLTITADYFGVENAEPLIVLCHQANWSRGEYLEIIPKLNQLGFSCLAIDQRSGKEVNGVVNETAKLAKEKSKGTQYWDAEQDVVAAVRYASQKNANIILWGSSYSASLALKVGQDEAAVNKVLSFSPGEYFGDFLDLKASITKLNKPVFVTCSKDEVEKTQPIFDVIPSEKKIFFKPETKGNHGSRALYKRFADNQAYWKAVTSFLEK